MARTLTTKDAYTLMNALVTQATGQTNIAAVSNLSDFISAGETVMSTGMENVMNSLTLVLGRTIIASRPYKARLDLMEERNDGLYSGRVRKISYYSKFALPSGDFNTDLYTNFADGYTSGNNSGSSVNSQWEQHQQYPLEMNFAGQSTWQDAITIYEDQLQQAFRSPEDFNAFVAGYLQEHANDIESQREAWNRAVLLNKIASVVDMSAYMPGSLVDLKSEYNTRFGTNYTSAQLLSTYLDSFLAFFVSEFKKYSMFLTERTANYHWAPTKTVNGTAYKVLRHTPYEKQRVYLYEPLFTEAEAWVMPGIFNPQYLDIKTQYQPVSFWQAESARDSITVTPAITDADTTSATYGTQIAGSAVSIAHVIGMITDVDGLMTNIKLDSARSTPVEARKGYRNVWNTFLKNGISDNTENVVVFYLS